MSTLCLRARLGSRVEIIYNGSVVTEVISNPHTIWLRVANALSNLQGLDVMDPDLQTLGCR